MSDERVGRGLLLARNNILFFGLLVALSLAFFSLVRDNTFWHTGDYFYLEQALDVQESWSQIFVSYATQPFQPLVKLVFYLEYSVFGFSAWKYYLFNIFIHSINAFLVYFLVFTLLRDRLIATLSAILFACAVGNYGKAVMVVSGISDLLITMLTLLTLLIYFKNELEKGGRVASIWFFGTLVFFVLSLLTKLTSFSILGCMLAFHFFFRSETKKRVLCKTFLTIAAVAFVALCAKLIFSPYLPGRETFHFDVPLVIRLFGSYLVRMVFPIHASSLVSDSGLVVRFIYNVATEIRVITFLCILSYSIFGFVFGNRTIRFFITWTYITVTPFCFFEFPKDWLNIRYLYLVSIGFIMILASGTVLASRLLYQKAWRRFLTYSLPLLFILLSQFIIFRLDKNYEKLANSHPVPTLRENLMTRYNDLRTGGSGTTEEGQNR
ncbi:MAG: glycosyltransferase family 39 protein [Candidatus Latescibacterota bacterium]|nr:MAG: glycosyltransferase family 39 protein [Candidatus Latescibacterota bacterium]